MVSITILKNFLLINQSSLIYEEVGGGALPNRDWSFF
jgi:hypothetical protein